MGRLNNLQSLVSPSWILRIELILCDVFYLLSHLSGLPFFFFLHVCVYTCMQVPWKPIDDASATEM